MKIFVTFAIFVIAFSLAMLSTSFIVGNPSNALLNGCTGDPHDSETPTGNPHDNKDDLGNPHDFIFGHHFELDRCPGSTPPGVHNNH
jgi:hypothetical protein